MFTSPTSESVPTADHFNRRVNTVTIFHVQISRSTIGIDAVAIEEKTNSIIRFALALAECIEDFPERRRWLHPKAHFAAILCRLLISMSYW